jgi:hypothetical protein
LKKLLLSILFFKTALGFCQEAVFNVKYSVVKFPKTQEGIKRNFVFEFKNSGSIPLEIYSVDVQCSCIQVTLSNDIIKPGEDGRLEVVFDTNGKLYHQDHSIILNTNSSKRREKLRFKIFVEPKPVNKG